MKLLHSRHGVELCQDEADGKYVVTRDGNELVRTGVESLAQVIFEEGADDADPKREVRARERAHYDMQRARSESFARRAGNARKSGGKGGRGGV